MKKRSPQPVTFLVLTRSPADELRALLRRHGLREDEIVVRGVAASAMPAHLSAADIGLSFIKSCFSKKGSSPTKVAEYLACGLPVVLNGDIGDQADLTVEKDACIVTPFSEEDLSRAAADAIALATRPLEQRVAVGRRVASAHFDLERVGVARYERLYRAIAG